MFDFLRKWRQEWFPTYKETKRKGYEFAFDYIENGGSIEELENYAYCSLDAFDDGIIDALRVMESER